VADSEVQKTGDSPEPTAEQAVAAAQPEAASPEPVPAQEEGPSPAERAEEAVADAPVAGEPADGAEAEAQPDEAQADEAKPDEAQPDEAQPDEAQPDEAEPEQAAAEAEPEEARAEEPPPKKKEPADGEAATVDAPGEDEEQDTPFEKLVARARRFSEARVKTILESLLFVTDKPLSEEAIQQTTGISIPVIKEQLQKLQGHYRDGVRGIVLHEVAGGWQFRTDAGAAEYVRRFLKVKPQRLTRAALETLAIIAYRQPVTRPEIEDIRAVDSGAVLKALLERHLVKIIGKRDEPGRPLLYGTTKEFLEFVNLRDLGSLPTLREFQELTDESRAVVEKETGEPAPALQTTENLVSELRDDSFEQKLSESNAEADDALAELETALADSEQKTKEAVRTLNPQQPPADPSTPPVSPAEADDSPDET